MSRNAIHSYAYPEGIIQGRALAVRERATDHDLMHLAVYFPTSGTDNSMLIAYELISWLRQLFRAMPLRCLPIIYMDLNSGIGLHRGEGAAEHIDTNVHGGCNLGIENEHGVLFREFC